MQKIRYYKRLFKKVLTKNKYFGSYENSLLLVTPEQPYPLVILLKFIFKTKTTKRRDLAKTRLILEQPLTPVLKVRKNGKQKTRNLFCNIAAKRVE